MRIAAALALAVTAAAAAAGALAAGGARPARAAPQATVTVSAVGDIAMVASPVPFFVPEVTRRIRAQVAIGNLEGTLTDGGSSKCGAAAPNCFAFRAPPSYARLLRTAGFTVLNTANNHAFDFGTSGVDDTHAALDAAGLRYTGRPGEAAIFDVGETTVAVIGFAPYPWAQSLTDLEGARRIVHAADGIADLVIVTMHAGKEGNGAGRVRPGTETYLGENRGDAVAFSRAVIEAGADLVVGHGPHVLRGMEWYRGRLIAYSMGNFLGPGTFSLRGPRSVSGVLRVTLRADGSWAGGSLVPVRLLDPGVPRLDPSRAALAEVRRLSRDDFGARGMTITATGRIVPPGRAAS